MLERRASASATPKRMRRLIKKTKIHRRLCGFQEFHTGVPIFGGVSTLGSLQRAFSRDADRNRNLNFGGQIGFLGSNWVEENPLSLRGFLQKSNFLGPTSIVTKHL